MEFIYHKALSSNATGAASSSGLSDTDLSTRNLDSVELYVEANATDGANFAHGFKNVILESERNNVGVGIYIGVYGATRLGSDPTTAEAVEADPDPSFGLENSTAFLSKNDDIVDIVVESEAGDWSNQAIAYGIRGGNSKLDKHLTNDPIFGTSVRGLRPTLMTYEGDDQVVLEVTASNNGNEYINQNDLNAQAGKQRAVGLFQALVDLGDGNDKLDIRTATRISSNEKMSGSKTISGLSDFFAGPDSATQSIDSAAACDIYESVVLTGRGDDKIDIYNAWNSSILMGDGDDSLTLSAGNDLYVQGGDGTDVVTFEALETQYIGLTENWHKFITSEGSVFVSNDIDSVSIGNAGVDLEEPEVDSKPGPVPVDYKLPVTENSFEGTRKNDDLKGTVRADFITGKKSDDLIRGLKRDDVLIGNLGNDSLEGGRGDDYLNGSRGDDMLTGGRGADVFQISKGDDLVDDFSIAQGDRIALDRSGEYQIVDDSEGVLIMASAKKQMFLDGVDYDDVIAAGVDLFVQPV